MQLTWARGYIEVMEPRSAEGEVSVWAPSAVFSLGSLVATAVVFFLPETTNKNMPQGINDEEKDNDC
ncbi:hypothetical protein Pcinc_006477 [Petrolisthes cinctipes]|uniref:Uncharacterized protein n=1 Tax=Petrolisthes cinctipes TaxID=88211 RepID=A0AAE1GCU0_PETCI|nr:hypothetical protein Pcinc_006477 [Petrolisthes cinctipes]